jgi:hypothetical protein
VTGVETLDQMAPRHLIDEARRYLTGQGVDVDEALAAAEHVKRHRGDAAACRVKNLALTLKKAKRAVEVANILWRQTRSPADFAELTAAMAAERRADAALQDACCNDQALISAVKRRFAR